MAESGHSHVVEWGLQNGLTIGRQSLGDRLVMRRFRPIAAIGKSATCIACQSLILSIQDTLRAHQCLDGHIGTPGNLRAKDLSESERLQTTHYSHTRCPKADRRCVNPSHHADSAPSIGVKLETPPRGRGRRAPESVVSSAYGGARSQAPRGRDRATKPWRARGSKIHGYGSPTFRSALACR